jgi:intracellular septation protein A
MRSARPSLWVPFLPWFVFHISDRNAGIGPEKSAVLAAGTAIVLWLTYFLLHKSGWLSGLGVLLFGGLAAQFGALGGSTLDGYDRALAFVVLALALGASSLTRPFSLECLRVQVPTNRALSTGFLRANRRLTLWWSIFAAGIATSLALGPKHDHPMSATIFNWFIPIALVALAGALATQMINREASTADPVTMRTAFGLFDIELAMDSGGIDFGARRLHLPRGQLLHPTNPHPPSPTTLGNDWSRRIDQLAPKPKDPRREP